MQRRREAPFRKDVKLDFWSPILVAIIAPPCIWLVLQMVLTVNYQGNILTITDLYPGYYVIFFMAGWMATICYVATLMVVYDYRLQLKKSDRQGRH